MYRCHVEKLWYLPHRLTDCYEIWHNDASWASESRQAEPNERAKWMEDESLNTSILTLLACFKWRWLRLVESCPTCRISSVDCWQNKTATDESDNAASSSKPSLGTDAAVTTVIDGRFRAPAERLPAQRPPTETAPSVNAPTDEPARHPWQRPLQPRQLAVDEFRRPNPDELVLGFRRHRMMSQQQPAITSRQVINTESFFTRHSVLPYYDAVQLADRRIESRYLFACVPVLWLYRWTWYSHLTFWFSSPKQICWDNLCSFFAHWMPFSSPEAECVTHCIILNYCLVSWQMEHYAPFMLAFSALTLLVGQQKGHLACKKTDRWSAGVVICLGRGAYLHMVQLMPLPLWA